MTRIILIEKACTIKSLNVKDFSYDNLYKKCCFKKPDGFIMRTEWKITNDKYGFNKIQLWARDTGKAGFENKYECPPPIDTKLYFGTMAIIALNKDKVVDITIDEWNKIYEELYGGFEDIGENDTESEDELDNVPKEMKTKEGYLKDGFVVDTKEQIEDDEDYDGSNSELDYEEYYYSDDE